MPAGGGAVTSILVLDKDGLLRNGASPNLPADYLKAIDRRRPSPLLGTCAAAAATGRVVITPDFFADDNWAELRHLRERWDSSGHGACRLGIRREMCLALLELIFENRELPLIGNNKAEGFWLPLQPLC